MTQPGEAAEKEYIPDGFEARYANWDFQLPQALEFRLGEIDDLFLGGLQGGTEGLIGKIGVVTMISSPFQEPFQESQFLLNGGIPEADDIFIIVLVPISLLLAGRIKDFLLPKV
jgi:hypothetical protein